MTIDLRGLPYMPLYIERLQKSKAWLLCKREPELAFYLMNLWMRSWQDVPAGTIENDDDVLADAAMCDVKRWAKIKGKILRGWVEANGRLSHPVVTEIAAESWGHREAYRRRTERARQAKAQKRTEAVTISVTEAVKESVTEAVKESVTEAATEDVTALKGRVSKNTPKAPTSLGGYVPVGGVAWTKGGPEGDPSDGAAVAWSFHALKDHHFGIDPPATISARDISICRGWIERGASYEQCRALMDERMKRMEERGDGPPGGPAFFEKAIGDLCGRAA